ncbi:hypothetical protein L227DRAFT_657108 [Lentinus tigrinus ALCF2SS1-6]|uniref:Uncharacterized protein n=2 Tax=Lentinus tigrinus TaxID=5365 RepID=A0A5C2RTU3_9APHY|nr:hypothetical protein L227DRAFT_657108 [Lentinus tigrinus ALCF2SS1-6]
MIDGRTPMVQELASVYQYPVHAGAPPEDTFLPQPEFFPPVNKNDPESTLSDPTVTLSDIEGAEDDDIMGVVAHVHSHSAASEEYDWDKEYINGTISEHETASDGEYLPGSQSSEEDTCSDMSADDTVDDDVDDVYDVYEDVDGVDDSPGRTRWNPPRKATRNFGGLWQVSHPTIPVSPEVAPHPSESEPNPPLPRLDQDDDVLSILTDLTSLYGGEDDDATTGTSEAQGPTPADSEESEVDFDQLYIDGPLSDRETASDGEYLPDANAQIWLRTPVDRSRPVDMPRRKNPPRGARPGQEAVSIPALPRRSRRLKAVASEHDDGHFEESYSASSDDNDYGVTKKRTRGKGGKTNTKRQRRT